MSINPFPELKSLFEAALNEFENRTGTNLVQHQIIDKLVNCQSADSVIGVLQEQAQALHNVRGDNGQVMMWLKQTVNVLHGLSTSGALGEGIGLPFPPAKAIFAGIGILLEAIKDVGKSYDAIAELFESFESFLRRLDAYTKMPSTTEMKGIIIKILIELFSTISLAIQQAKQGRLKRLGKRLLGENDVEAVLQRLDRLTREEAQTTATKTLELVYGLVKNIKVVMDGGVMPVDIQQLLSDMNKSRRDQLQETFRRWLSPPDPSKNHNLARKAHHEGSAEWFVQGNTFSEWKQMTGSLLWIHGIPGSGKSILSSTIIEEFMRRRNAGLASVAFFYFDFGDSSKQDVRGALSSLLAQLSAQSDACCGVLERLYSEHDSGSKEPSEHMLEECLKSMLALQYQGPIFLVFDGIDECPDSTGALPPRENVLKLIKALSELHYSQLSICVTSRLEADIEAVLKPLASHTVSLHDEDGQKEDIANYIKWFVNSKTRIWREEDKELVIKKLSERAGGTFKWVSCQLNRLRHCLPPDIRRALDELPETLDETYERTLLDIHDEKWNYAHQLFQCIAVARRPLHVEELAGFLTFKSEEGGSLTFEENWRPENRRDMVLSICSSLISIVNVNGSPVIQFSHFSVKEYLTSNRIAKGHMSRYYIPLESAHLFVTQTCLAFLIRLPEHVTKSDIEKFPLAQYAGQYWAEHAEFGNVSSHTEDLIKRLFNPRNYHFRNWVWIYDTISCRSMGSESPPHPELVPLHYAARHGFHRVAEWLITACSQDVNDSRYYRNTPTHIASEYGQFKVMQVLLKHHADVHIGGIGTWTPLHAASWNPKPEIIRLLLDHGADVNSKNVLGITPLCLLLHHSTNLEVAEILLKQGADPNMLSEYSEGPLYMALQKGHPGLVQLLLKHGADPNARDDYGETLLHVAYRRGDLKVRQGLLQLGVDVYSQDIRDTSVEVHTETHCAKIITTRRRKSVTRCNPNWLFHPRIGISRGLEVQYKEISCRGM